jgi:hypothetical protein
LAFEEEIRDVRNKARDEEIKKAQYLVKSYEQKIKLAEEGKQLVSRKVTELLKDIQEKEHVIVQIEREKNDDITKLQQDNADLNQQKSHLNYLLNKAKGELSDKDSLIGRSVNDNDQELKLVRQQLEAKKQEISQLSNSMRELRLTLK